MSQPKAEPFATGGREFTFRTVWLLVVTLSAVALVIAATAALNTALAAIAPDIHATAGQLTWMLDSYTLALAALLLPAGAIGDRFGRRGILVAGLAVFAGASLAPVWMDDPISVITFRCVAGIGAAFVMPATLSLITSGLPETRRTLGVTIWAAVVGVGAIAGFFVTGVLLEFFGWRSIFLTFGVWAALLVVAACTISTSRDRDPGPFDILGSITSAGAVGIFVLGLIEAPHRGWGDPIVLCALIGGLALGTVFAFTQLRGRRTLLDVRLFGNRAFGAGAVVVTVMSFAPFGLFFVFLQNLQINMGYTPLAAAFALMPMVVAIIVASLLGNWAAAHVPMRVLLAAGTLIVGVAVVVLGLANFTHYEQMAIVIVVIGFGSGIAAAPSTAAIMTNTPADNHGVGSAVNDTARELGAAIGIALAGSISAAGYSNRIAATADGARESLQTMAAELSRNGQQLQSQLVAGQADVVAQRVGNSLAEAMAVADQLGTRLSVPLARQIADGAREAFITPMNTVYIVLGSIVIVIAAIVALWAPSTLATPLMPDADRQAEPEKPEDDALTPILPLQLESATDGTISSTVFPAVPISRFRLPGIGRRR